MPDRCSCQFIYMWNGSSYKMTRLSYIWAVLNPIVAGLSCIWDGLSGCLAELSYTWSGASCSPAGHSYTRAWLMSCFVAGLSWFVAGLRCYGMSGGQGEEDGGCVVGTILSS